MGANELPSAPYIGSPVSEKTTMMPASNIRRILSKMILVDQVCVMA
jgi:hypothetical protein